MEWNIGDVVQSKAGGPRMTVHDNSDGYAICNWLDTNKLQ